MDLNDEKVKELVGEIKNGLTKEVVEELKKELPLRKDIFGADNGEADKKIEAQQKSADWLKSMANHDFARAKELGGVLKGMSEGTNADGGFLVPAYFSNEIIRVANDYGLVRKEARRVPMKGLTLNMPSADGVSVYRISEGANSTSSKPTISRTTLTAKKLVALIPVSNELLEDADPDVVTLLSLLAAEAFAGKEDEWGLKGLAASEGVFQSTNVTGITLGSTKTAFTDATLDDFLTMQNELKAKAVGGAKYVMHHTVLNLLRQKKDSQNRYLLGDPNSQTPTRMWDLPVVTNDAMPASAASAAATKFAALANFNYMLFGDRKQITMEISREATVTDTDGSTLINSFAQDMSVVKFVERVDIQLAAQADAFAWIKTAAS